MSMLLIVNTCSPWWVVEPTWLSTRTPYYAWYTSLLIITTYGCPLSIDLMSWCIMSRVKFWSYVIQRNYDDHSIAVANFGFCSVDEWFNLHYNVARLLSWAALLCAVFLFRYKCNFKHFSRWRFGIGFVVATNHCHFTVTVLQWLGNVQYDSNECGSIKW